MKRPLRDLDVEGKRVLVRVDYNVPLSREGVVESDMRIRATLETLQDLRSRGAYIVLLTHLGRPEGKKVSSLSTRALVSSIGELLGDASLVVHIPDITGKQALKATNMMGPGEMHDGKILLLENLRFDPGEEANDPTFARALADLGDVYVNEAFSVSHRAHASLVGIPNHLPNALGIGSEKELQALTSFVDNPEKPLHVVFGGVKIETRVPMMEHFIEHSGAEKLLLGGALTNAFFVAQGHSVGDSPYDPSYVALAKELMEKYGEYLVLPTDVVVATERSDNAEAEVVSIDAIPDGMMILDLGPETIRTFLDVVSQAKTVIWNGPMGAFEYAPFMKGTKDFAEGLAGLSATTIIGGGDTVSLVEQLGLTNNMTFVSTGGGAALTLFEGKSLPAIEVLDDASSLIS